MSIWSTPLGIAGIVFIIIGLIMALVGIILLVVDKDVAKPWYIWFLLAGGIIFGIAGGIMLAVEYSRMSKTTKKIKTYEMDCSEMPQKTKIVYAEPENNILYSEEEPEMVYTKKKCPQKISKRVYMESQPTPKVIYSSSPPKQKVIFTSSPVKQPNAIHVGPTVMTKPTSQHSPGDVIAHTHLNNSHVEWEEETQTIINESNGIPVMDQNGRKGTYYPGTNVNTVVKTPVEKKPAFLINRNTGQQILLD